MDKQAQPEVDRIRHILAGQMPFLRERYNVGWLGIFGSYARQEERADSDLDVLITFSDPPSLLTYIALENHLSDVLGIKVDLVMREALKQHLGERILREVVPV